MTDSVKSPEDCETMADVRAGVDALDRELLRLHVENHVELCAAHQRLEQERGALSLDSEAARPALEHDRVPRLRERLLRPVRREEVTPDLCIRGSGSARVEP